MTDHASTPMTQALRLVHLAEVDTEGSLRLHLDTDHGAQVFEDDDPDALQAMHEGMHRQRITPPQAAEPETPAAIVEARAEVEHYRLNAAEKAYDVAVPDTLRERMAYARALSQSGLIPRAFRSQRPGEDGVRETTANVLLATELGRELGLSPLQALTSVNVVEGRPGLGAEAQLARILDAGHDAWIDEASDSLSATVHGIRYRDGEPGRQQSFTYTLEDAQRAGLCRIVDGRAHARSKSGNPLPWETATPDMLVWRATTRMGKRMFPDVVRGLAVSDGGEGEHYAPARVTTAEQAPARVRTAEPVEGVEDQVQADLALFPDGRWWEHAGAQVRRRTKLQLAADRLADVRAANGSHPRIPEPPNVEDPDAEPVDAEVVNDTGQPADVPGVDVYPPAGATDAEAATVAEPPQSDLDALHGPGAEATLAEAYADGSVFSDSAEAAPPAVLAEAPENRRADLWAQVFALAEAKGKTVHQLMARHVLAVRKNPEDMEADDLAAFLDAQAP